MLLLCLYNNLDAVLSLGDPPNEQRNVGSLHLVNPIFSSKIASILSLCARLKDVCERVIGFRLRLANGTKKGSYDGVALPLYVTRPSILNTAKISEKLHYKLVNWKEMWRKLFELNSDNNMFKILV